MIEIYLTLTFVLHARTHTHTHAKKYESKIVIGANGKSAEATKLMALMGLGVKCGQTVEVTVEGTDEDTACEGIRSFLESNL